MALNEKTGVYETPKDYTGWIVGMAVILVFGLILLGFHLKEKPVDNRPMVGDIWEYYGSGDPFTHKEVNVKRIIDKKQGYIQYVLNEKDTLSEIERLFLQNSKRLSRITDK